MNTSRKFTDIRKMISLSTAQAEKLNRLAVADGRSEAGIIRQLIEAAPEPVRPATSPAVH